MNRQAPTVDDMPTPPPGSHWLTDDEMVESGFADLLARGIRIRTWTDEESAALDAFEMES